MADRIILTDISSRTWEHPADRAALNTLRALPGFDGVVRKVAGMITERGLRHLFLANAVRVGPRQRPKLDDSLTEVIGALDWPTRPQLYVSQNPIANAFAVGFEQPFIVINSGAIEILDDDELRFVIAHEVGHIMSGHMTYRTLAIILLTFGVGSLPFMAGLALFPFQLALLEWYRKSELSSDRAGLLGIQDSTVSLRTFMKLAGGDSKGDVTDIDAFMEQAAEYQIDDTTWDTILKLLATAFREHPFATMRASELKRWMDAGAYNDVLAGTYVRRGQEKEQPLGTDFREAASYYGKQAREAMRGVEDVLGRAKSAFEDAFKGSTSEKGG